MICFDFSQGKSCQECFDGLKKYFGDQSPSKLAMFRWYKHFGNGQLTLDDSDRCGRLFSVVTQENVSKVRKLISKDQRITYQEIEYTLKISARNVRTILHECLGVRKRYTRWVPHNIREEQKQGRVDWCQPMLTKFDEGRSRQMWDIITGDETFIYPFDPEMKQQLAVWMF